VRSVTKLRGYRQDILDERAGQAVAGIMVEEAGAPILLVVRVKVDSEQKLSELELVATRSRADGMIYSIDTYSGAPTLGMNIVPKPEQLETRERATAIAMHYPRGLSNAKTFNAVGTPFAENAYRIENGALMAGPGCTIIPGCSDIGNQSLAVFDRLGRVTIRDIVVDERMGIVIMRLSWDRSGPGSDKLTAWEMFKVYDGHIHAVEAYMRVFPPEQDLGGVANQRGDHPALIAPSALQSSRSGPKLLRLVSGASRTEGFESHLGVAPTPTCARNLSGSQMGGSLAQTQMSRRSIRSLPTELRLLLHSALEGSEARQQNRCQRRASVGPELHRSGLADRRLRSPY